MPLTLNYLPNIEKKTGKTTKDFVALAIESGFGDPEMKPGIRIAWLKKEFGLGHGHAMWMAHAIKGALLEKSSTKKTAAKKAATKKTATKKTATKKTATKKTAAKRAR